MRPSEKSCCSAAHASIRLGTSGPFRHGFTLIELVVVLAILAILSTIIVAAVVRVRAAAARLQCANNVRQLALAVHHYENSRGQLPQGCFYFTNNYYEPGISWHTSILPYVEQDQLGNMAWQLNVADPSHFLISAHDSIGAHVLSTYLCPSESRRTGFYVAYGSPWGCTSYLGVAGTDNSLKDGVFHSAFTIRFTDITDGTSNTLMIGERPPGPDGLWSSWYSEWGYRICQLSAILPAGPFTTWMPNQCRPMEGSLRPGRSDQPCDLGHFWSLHQGGANFAFADGTVRFLDYSRSSILPALATRAGGEVVSDD
jgi:prepilin-type N-terminal cleavage/methylation domain-containing protein/prepilin-type processing-associated H-X9-DG protein